MSDIAWTALYLAILIISAVPAWIPYTVGGISLYIAGLWTWVHISRVRERRQALAEQLAADTAKYEEGWSASDEQAAEALDYLFTRLGPPDLEADAGPYFGDTFTPEAGSDPWLRDLWPDAPDWEDA